MPRRRIRRQRKRQDEEKSPANREAVRAVRSSRSGVSYHLQQVAAAKHYPLSPDEVVDLQQQVGNQSVDRLLAGKAGGGSAVLQMENEDRPAVARLNGMPYYGSRKVNEKMDGFEAEQNVFGPLIFRQYARDLAVWKPVMHFVTQFWLNYGNKSGIALQPGEEPAVWRLLRARLKPGEMKTVKTLYQDASPASRPDVLMDAFWVEFTREYDFCHKKAEQAYRATNFLLWHEFYAAFFGLVEPPFRYLARRGK